MDQFKKVFTVLFSVVFYVIFCLFIRFGIDYTGEGNVPMSVLKRCKEDTFSHNIESCFNTYDLFLRYYLDEFVVLFIFPLSFSTTIIMAVISDKKPGDNDLLIVLSVFLSLHTIAALVMTVMDYYRFYEYIEPYSDVCIGEWSKEIIMVKNKNVMDFFVNSVKIETVEKKFETVDNQLFVRYGSEIYSKDFSYHYLDEDTYRYFGFTVGEMPEIANFTTYSIDPGVKMMFGFNENIIKFCVNVGVSNSIVYKFTQLFYDYVECKKCLSSSDVPGCQFPSCTVFNF